MTTANDHLNEARYAKHDEFYTSASDVEREMKHYGFNGRTVYCPCDDPAASEFYAYFKRNFDRLGLRRLLASGYAVNDDLRPVGAEFDGVTERPIALLTGDFASAECCNLMAESDVVVTNPPFSRWREFMEQVTWRRKQKYLVMGPLTQVKSPSIFTHFRDNFMWYGVNRRAGEWFQIPPHYPLEGATRLDDDGRKWAQLGNVHWYTNMPHRHRPGPLKLTATYDPKRYPKFANCDAINIDRTRDIPHDYPGRMGVPISFLEKHCHAQFRLLSTLWPVMYLPNGQRREMYVRIIIERSGYTYTSKKSLPSGRDGEAAMAAI